MTALPEFFIHLKGLEDTTPVDAIEFGGNEYLAIPIQLSGIEASLALYHGQLY